MINTIKFYTKLLYQIASHDVVNKDDYRRDYDKVAKTYNNWLQKMGEFTNRIIKPEYILDQKRINILDFACGTGYISRRLLEKNIDCSITAVDISEQMLRECQDLRKHEVQLVNTDGIAFLKNCQEKYDLIFCGWALPYFNHNSLIKLFRDKLSEGGIVGVISNSQGTLQQIEEIFFKVMKDNPEEVEKPMDIRFNLPAGKEGLNRWFTNYGFEILEIDEAEVFFAFDKPEELYDWINKTGAIAGTAQIFKNPDKIKNCLIKEIEKKKYDGSKYVINHRFAYGLFKKSGGIPV